MGNSLRCCLACVLPCGALDVIRVVHLSGHVDEYSRPIAAAEVLAANPNHVLSKPCSQVGGGARWILIVSPESELRRGDIYFLIPATSTSVQTVAEKRKKYAQKIKQQQQQQLQQLQLHQQQSKKPTSISKATDGDDESHNRYFAEVMSDKHSGGQRRRRSGARVAVWRPHLESICEDV